MKNQILEEIVPAMEKAITEASIALNRELLRRAGEDPDESELIKLLTQVNTQAIEKFDEVTIHSFPKSYDFRKSYHDCIIVASSYHTLSIFYAAQVDSEKSVKKQIRDYNELMAQGYKKLGLPKSVIEKAVSQGEAVILQDLLKRSIRL